MRMTTKKMRMRTRSLMTRILDYDWKEVDDDDEEEEDDEEDE